MDSSSKWALLRHSRRSKFLIAMTTGPTAIIKDWPVQRSVQHDGTPFDLFRMSDDWCLEFLRFTKKLVCEMLISWIHQKSFLRNIPAYQQLLSHLSVIGWHGLID